MVEVAVGGGDQPLLSCCSSAQSQLSHTCNHKTRRLPEGDYVVEVAVGGGGQPPRSDNTLAFVSTTLAVSSGGGGGPNGSSSGGPDGSSAGGAAKSSIPKPVSASTGG